MEQMTLIFLVITLSHHLSIWLTAQLMGEKIGKKPTRMPIKQVS
jgi:hypothetical protein